MTVTTERIVQFLAVTASLKSFKIFCAYLLMIAFARIWQRNTKPVTIKPVLIAYNFACCILSIYTTVGFVQGIYKAGDVYLKKNTTDLRTTFFLYWLTKNIELLDTVFMIVRHKSRQISFLHVYHHSSMILLSDFAYHYTSWPAIAVFLGLNSFVHIVLYFYYAMTSINASYTQSWKQRMTEIQIIQFLIDFVFAGYGYIHHGFCIYGFIYGIIMIYLFSNFYYIAYIKKKNRVE